MDADRGHPAQPEETEHGFEEGLERAPQGPDERREPDFARGQGRDLPSDDDAEDRFSRGQESPAQTPEKQKEGRFSEGQDHGPPPHDR